jgi:hypothetical protein
MLFGVPPNRNEQIRFVKLQETPSVGQSTIIDGLAELEDAYGIGLPTARLRGRLLALFGEPTGLGDEDRITFEYEVMAELGTKRAFFALHDYRGAQAWDVSARQEDHEFARWAWRAFVELLAETSPHDYEAKFYEYYPRQYGVRGGVPWQGECLDE